ncbi:MAG: ATP-binding protein [Roseateles asaccharophilus]|uniref:histidine kinase n=1 Tax=Roseateles asaccharophilus TaxID=582607 RepID=A0A4R6MT89_9BURK|nr:ATP-binding protein [Roseateles asaccharophilus]MDN3546469.1 ATP-binding protein [Roseateles asaccharophilus]TDP05509.1 signal transduction histidine kinase [Roseateles asaccharophilus]
MEQRSLYMRSLYQITVWLSAAVLLVASLLYGWALSQQFRQRSLADLEAQSEQLRLVMNQHTERARHHVGAMQLSISAALGTPQNEPPHAVRRVPAGRAPADLHAPWDALPDASREQLGSLFVHPDLPEGPERSMLDAVMAMLPGVAADHRQQQIYQWSYFYDAGERWSVLYPALPKIELLKATGSADMAAALKVVYEAGGTYPMRLVGPLANPGRRQVWTTPYVDAGGKGLMVSLLEAVYHRGAIAGAVGTDLTLGMLDASLQAVPLNLGRAMVVTPSGLLLADSGGALQGRKQPLTLQELDAGVVSSATLFGRSNARLHTGEQGLWISHELDGTPWRLLVWVSESQLNAATLRALQPYLLLELLFIAMLLLLAWWQHRRFTRPAMALADYVDKVSRDAQSPAPQVPDAWKPWFDQVAATAHEREGYLTQTRDYAGKLELMVSERTAALEQANRQLEEAMRSLQQAQQQLVLSEKLAALGTLTAGMAHELNTPLGNVLTAVTTVEATLQALRAAIDSGQARRAGTLQSLGLALQSSELAQSNVNRALTLVKRFRQLGELHEAGSEQELDLHEFLQGLCTHWSSMACAHGRRVGLECPAPLMCRIDAQALGEALTQLVENAFVHGLKPHDASGRVQLQVEVLPGTPSQLQLRLWDNGRGLAPRALHHLFDPFYTSQMGKGNGGLGAYLAYLLVTSRLHGSIHARSELGEGLRVDMLLPLEVADNPQPLTLDAPARQHHEP